MWLLVLWVQFAAAFCGTYVAVGDDAPTNEGSKVAIVRQGGVSTLTMSNDVHGSVSDFAMVIPVPELVVEAALKVVDPEIFSKIDGYSAARLVSYTCADFAPREGDSDTDSDTDSDADYDTGGTVVEGEYIVGEYDVVVLSSSESTSLVSWLQNNGYNVPSESVTVLGEYIDAGSYFVAAQVRPDAGVVDGDTLSPLQISYADTTGVLPIRLGTLNSAGEQDLTIFGINDPADGKLAIANYPDATLETNCMLPEDQSLGEWVDAQIDAALPVTGDAHWVTEFAWENGGCDPCTPDGELTEVDLTSLGFVPDPHYGYAYTFTRLHTRYTPEQVTQDLVLYPSGIRADTQLRYIDYNHELEQLFRVCGVGWVEDGGSCDFDDDEADGDTAAGDDPALGDTATACGCGGEGGPAVMAGALLVAMAARRRRALR